MLDTHAAAAEIDAVLYQARERHPDTHVTLCGCGSHLRVSRGWRRFCLNCDQPIAAGDLGPVTWDPPHQLGNPPQCGSGSHSFQHGCGTWNTPTEVTVDPDDYEDLDAAVDAAVALLEEEIAEEVADACLKVRRELIAEMRHAIAEEARDPENAISDTDHGRGGVYRIDGGEVYAYAPDPADDEELLEITEKDLAQGASD